MSLRPSRLLTTGNVLAAILLAAYWTMAVTGVAGKSTTVDEIAHLTAGYSYWKFNDYRLDAESANLTQRIMALPLLWGDYKFPPLEQDAWRQSNQWAIGQQFFYKMGNDTDEMLAKARAAVATMGLLLGLLVYGYSSRLFGQAGGVVSLAMFTFCPTMLAHGALATTDMITALMFLLCIMAFWSLLHRLTWLNLSVSLLAAGMLLLCKTSSLLVAPMMALLVLVRMLSSQPMLVRLGRPVEIAGRGWRLAVILGLLVAHATAAYILIWAAYGFRYSAFGPAGSGRDTMMKPWQEILQGQSRFISAVNFTRQYRAVPEAYLWGLAYTINSVECRPAFLNGRYSYSGWPWFFPYAFAVKTPLPVPAVALLAAWAAWRKWRATRGIDSYLDQPPVRRALYDTSPLWVLMLVYWAAAITSHLNIGHRHLLPVYAPLYILAGAAAYWIVKKRPLRRLLVILALAAIAAESLTIRPNYLSYFNALAGGPGNGYKHLVDSNVDWGQDLPSLKLWLDQNAGGQNVYLSYFGNGSPAHCGIAAKRLRGVADLDMTGRERFDLQGGVYCISATMLQSVLLRCWGPWVQAYEREYQDLRQALLRNAPQPTGPLPPALMKFGDSWSAVLDRYEQLRLGRLCAYLRQRPPDDMVNYSILIYRMSDQDVTTAMDGPAAELLPDSASPYLARLAASAKR